MNIDVLELLRLIQGGGWEMSRFTMGCASISQAELVDGALVLRAGCDTVLGTAELDRVKVLADGQGEDVWKLTVRGPRSFLAQRKQDEGGGWYNVERVVTLFTLVNNGVLEKILRRSHQAA